VDRPARRPINVTEQGAKVGAVETGETARTFGVVLRNSQT